MINDTNLYHIPEGHMRLAIGLSKNIYGGVMVNIIASDTYKEPGCKIIPEEYAKETANDYRLLGLIITEPNQARGIAACFEKAANALEKMKMEEKKDADSD